MSDEDWAVIAVIHSVEHSYGEYITSLHGGRFPRHRSKGRRANTAPIDIHKRIAYILDAYYNDPQDVRALIRLGNIQYLGMTPVDNGEQYKAINGIIKLGYEQQTINSTLICTQSISTAFLNMCNYKSVAFDSFNKLIEECNICEYKNLYIYDLETHIWYYVDLEEDPQPVLRHLPPMRSLLENYYLHN